MSSTEVNKGTLIPRTLEQVIETLEEHISGTKLTTIEDVREAAFEIYDEGIPEYVEIKKQFYEVINHLSIPGYEDLCELRINGDGTIDFLTMHYNGGGHWTELIEDKLEKNHETT